MSVNLLEQNFINSFSEELRTLNGTDFEYLCSPVLSFVLKGDVQHKGHNLHRKPVKSTGDFISENFKDIGQCGTEMGYFEDLKKPLKDIDGAIKNHPQGENIHLFANQRATGGVLTDLDQEIENANTGKNVIVYDAEKIAKTILKNINNTQLVEAVLQYLPKTAEYYKILPQTNKLPSFTSEYFERKDEDKILKIVEKSNFVQIHGISGIGKTDTSISIAKKLKDKFDSIIWIEGGAFENEAVDLSSVHITKFGSTINLDFFIEKHKVLILVDNLNTNVEKFAARFEEANKNGSKCIISSLVKSFADDRSYHLDFLDDNIALEILKTCSIPPTKDEAEVILKTAKGYPLVLTLMKSAVETGDWTWRDFVKELNEIPAIEDQRGEKISRRIIGKFKDKLKEELEWINLLDNTEVSRHFLSNVIGKIKGNALEKRSLIRVQDSYYYRVHQIILDSIKSETSPDHNNVQYCNKLKSYLIQYNEVKSIDYYKFLLSHKSYLNKVYYSTRDMELKKVILYSIVQSSDFFHQPQWLFKELEQFILTPELNYQDLLLLIEKYEIELYQITKGSEEYKTLTDKILSHFNEILGKIKDDQSNRVLLHHTGKLQVKRKDFKSAKSLFSQVLALDPEADYVHLQLARIYLQEKDQNSAEMSINTILGRDIDLQAQSLAILLSFYELLSSKELGKLREKYIDNKTAFFTQVILQSLNEGFEHPYRVLDKLASHLGYVQKEVYKEICETLPFPANIDSNRDLMLAYATIQFVYYKLIKYSEIEDKETKLKEVFDISEKYFLLVQFQSDTERKKLLDLYLAASETKKAEEFIKSFEDQKNPFLLQNLCKFHRQNENLDRALSVIEEAIQNGKNEKPFHLAAFLNDKAETLYAMRKDTCILIIQDAIALQNTEKTILSWQEKLEKWKREFGGMPNQSSL